MVDRLADDAIDIAIALVGGALVGYVLIQGVSGAVLARVILGGVL